MQKLKDELSKIYTSKVFQDFLIRNNRLVQYHSESYKEYFGFNINRGKAENIKFYITYLRHLSEKELVQLLGFNPPINLKKAFQERSIIMTLKKVVRGQLLHLNMMLEQIVLQLGSIF